MTGMRVAPAVSVLLPFVEHRVVPVAGSKKQLWLVVVDETEARS
jgi:hypothetical protein